MTNKQLDPAEDPSVNVDANESDHPTSDSGGQSGDDQGLSSAADATDESVAELADTGQALEAEFVQGVEDADDHPEKPVPRRN